MLSPHPLTSKRYIETVSSQSFHSNLFIPIFSSQSCARSLFPNLYTFNFQISHSSLPNPHAYTYTCKTVPPAHHTPHHRSLPALHVNALFKTPSFFSFSFFHFPNCMHCIYIYQYYVYVIQVGSLPFSLTFREKQTNKKTLSSVRTLTIHIVVARKQTPIDHTGSERIRSFAFIIKKNRERKIHIIILS